MSANTVFCTSCGKPVNANASFCQSCGTAVAKSATSSASNLMGGSSQVAGPPQGNPPPQNFGNYSPQVNTPYAPPNQQPAGSGKTAFFYILSFLIPLAGWIIFFVYKGKPFESDRQLAKVAGILGIVSFGIGIALTR